MSAPVATQLILHSTDSVEVAYSDGSSLQLSPCATAFRYYYPRGPEVHPLQGIKKLQHRTEFVTSAFRHHVLEALDFRNRFAERPYLCLSLLQGKVLNLHADIEEIAWPRKVTTVQLHFETHGDVKLISEDEYAVFTLAANRQHYSVEYLAKVSQRDMQKKLSKSTEEKSEEPVKDTNKWAYSWVVQHGSVAACGGWWQQILDLVWNALTNEESSTGSVDSPRTSEPDHQSNSSNSSLNDSRIQCSDRTIEPSSALNSSSDNEPIKSDLKRLLRKDFRGCLFTPVPATLPLNCTAQHLHTWPLEEEAHGMRSLGKVKVICSQGIIYRLLWSQPRSVEIYPGDGSTFRSSGLAGHFFSQFIKTKRGIEELMYSVKTPPPTGPDNRYSIGRIITAGAGFLQQLCDDSLHLVERDDPCCWRHSSRSSKPHLSSSQMLEECTVDGLGRFTAYTNGHIRAVFSDRTCLDMCADFSNRFGSSHLKGEAGDHNFMQDHRLSASRLLDLPEGTCRLLLPTGHYHHVSTSQADVYERYVSAALEWAAWVNTKPSERHLFYKDTVFDPEKQRLIQSELKKIQCFNYIVEQKVLKNMPSLNEAQLFEADQLDSVPTEEGQGHGSTFDLEAVKAALQKTAAAVQDLDAFLGSNGEVQPVKDPFH